MAEEKKYISSIVDTCGRIKVYECLPQIQTWLREFGFVEI